TNPEAQPRRSYLMADDQPVQNESFETGTFAWSATSGVVTSVTSAHSGAFSVQLGSSNPYAGNSTLSQTITLPASGRGTLQFWFNPHSSDTVAHDQQQMNILAADGHTVLQTVLNTCTNSSNWTLISVDLARFRGQTIVLWFNVHDDGLRGTPTWM